MSNLVKCQQCGATLPENAPQGLCPNCLMALNLKTETLFTDDAPPAAQPPLPPDQIAPHFPQLEILECLGRGGMGVVYKARQKTLNRFVALKLLAPERVGDAKFAERFAREAQALAALNHPNIVTIHDFGQAGGFYFLLMEFVDGVNLRQILRARKFTPEEALAIVPPLCDALQFAHERGIVHRDIKPENLLLDKAGRVKVADFGIAKMLGTENGGKGGEGAAPESATQSAVGTPNYSAPEQKSDPQRVDSRADIYSLGVVFYEMLTGELPGKKIAPPSRKVQIDVRLDEVVLRALEKTPELRWQTAADLRTRVETIAGDPQPLASASGITRYKNSQWNFELDIPKGWNSFPPVPTNSPAEVIRFASNEDGTHLLIIFRFPHDPKQSLKQASDQVQQILASQGFGNFATSETTIGSRAALRLDFDKPKDGGTWSCRHYFVAEDTLKYALGFGTTNKSCRFELFDQMAKSFEFQRPGNAMPQAATTSQTPKPEIPPGCTATSGSLNRIRAQIVIQGLALAAAGYIMNFALGIIGILLFAVSSVLALGFGNSLEKLYIARWLVSIDGIIIMSSCFWFAFKVPSVSTPWFILIAVQCAVAIAYCVSCCVKLSAMNSAMQNQSPAGMARQRRLKRFFYVQLPVAFGILVFIRIFLLQPFRVETDVAAPEIPRGSHFLVWKLAHKFEPGDLVAYRRDNYANLGRVTGHADNGFVVVNRNGKADIDVPPQDIIGKVISVYWRASDSALLRPSTDGQPRFFKATGGTVEAHAVSLATLLAYAYGSPKLYIHWSDNRVILPPDVAGGTFDFVLESSDRPQEVLQAEIKKQLGLVAHRELRDAEVLGMFVSNPSVTAQAAAKGGNGSDTGAAPGRRQFEFTNMPIDDLSDFLEVSLGKLVINQTELTQNYSGSLKWNPQPDPAAELKEIQKVLGEQFGLELVPSRQAVEMLVVTKATTDNATSESGTEKLVKDGWDLWHQRQPAEAEAKFKRAAEISPTNAEAWNGLGWAEFNQGKNEEAKQAFQQVLMITPNHPAAMNGLGQICIQERKYSDAEKLLLPISEQSPPAWPGLARLFILEGKYDEAAAWAQKSVAAGQADNITRRILVDAEAKKLSDGLRFMIDPTPVNPPGAATTGPGTVIHLPEPGAPGGAPVEITGSNITYDPQNRTMTVSGGSADIRFGRTVNHGRELGLLGAWMEIRMFTPDQYWNLVMNKNPNCESFNRNFPYPGPAQVAVRMCINDTNGLETTWSWDKTPDGDTLKGAETDLQQLRTEAGRFYRLVCADGPTGFQPFRRMASGGIPSVADYTNAIALIDQMTFQMTASYIAIKNHDVKLGQNTSVAFAAMVHNYNELVRGSAYAIPHTAEMDKIAAALKAGDLDQAEALSNALDNPDEKGTDIGELKRKLEAELQGGK